MSGPDIYFVICTHGDGYGHNSCEYFAWYFDEEEANAAAAATGVPEGT